ncbi:SAM-dependent methyltransferase [Actinomadura roseirufa]|uniref:SAM-dependent methyltransferase n=1 Tax=Actinomadura roseirufa TaxID=2094049 RepID=UPI0010413002|nr:SAM-dependent methyltransferase [Actinomadura roseirufa]
MGGVDAELFGHARALISDSRAQVDTHDVPEVIAAARGPLDFDQPVAVLLTAVLHLTSDARRIIGEPVKEPASGSFIAPTHGEAGSAGIAAPGPPLPGAAGRIL